jgi:hypothetical protein
MRGGALLLGVRCNIKALGKEAAKLKPGTKWNPLRIELFAKNRVRISPIGEQSVIRPE